MFKNISLLYTFTRRKTLQCKILQKRKKVLTRIGYYSTLPGIGYIYFIAECKRSEFIIDELNKNI